jgi:hypothetical protein
MVLNKNASWLHHRGRKIQSFQSGSSELPAGLMLSGSGSGTGNFSFTAFKRAMAVIFCCSSPCRVCIEAASPEPEPEDFSAAGAVDADPDDFGILAFPPVEGGVPTDAAGCPGGGGGTVDCVEPELL